MAESRKAEAQRTYRERTGDVMGRTREAAMAELRERHRDEYEAILADLRKRARRKAKR